MPAVVGEFYGPEGIRGGEVLWNIIACPMWSVDYPLSCAFEMCREVRGSSAGDGNEGVVFWEVVG